VEQQVQVEVTRVLGGDEAGSIGQIGLRGGIWVEHQLDGIGTRLTVRHRRRLRAYSG
jgi:hypothetical protein